MSGGTTAVSRWHLDVARLASATVVAQLLPLLVLPWLTRQLPAGEIGRWTFFAALASNFAVVACLRYEFALVLPRGNASARALLSMCLALALAWGLALALVLALLATLWPWLGPGLGGLVGAGEALLPDTLRRWEGLGAMLGWLPLSVALAGMAQALFIWHNRAGRFEVIARARVAAAAATAGLQAGGSTVAARSGWLSGGLALAGAQVLGQAVGSLWMAWAARADLRQCAVQARRSSLWPRWRALARRYRQFPWVNTPHAFVNALQDTLALALVLAMAGPAAAGFFGLTVRVVMAPASLVGGALSEVLLGRTAQAWRDGEDLLPTLKRALRVLTLAALPMAGGLMLAAPPLFALVFGPAWREAGEWARWLAPWMAGRLIVGPLTVVPMIIGRQAAALAFSVCGNALYVLVLWAGLAWGNLEVASAAVSLAMTAYFAVFAGWLLQAARPRQVPVARA